MRSPVLSLTDAGARSCIAFIRSASLAAAVAAVIQTGGFVSTSFAGTYAFTTFAGAPGFGYADGPGTSARFAYPEGIAIDFSGTAYVADNGNYVIRKITPTGTVSTLAGLYAIASYADGATNNARFNSLGAIRTDYAGNLYVCDTGNNVIRKITPAGVVSTIAGVVDGVGSTDGAALSAEFNRPTVALPDAYGVIYVADTENDTIRKIANGTVTTLAGSPGVAGSADGTGSAARFNRPEGLVLDSGQNLYVSDTGNNTIRKITSDGVVTTVAGAAGPGGYLDGAALAARFNSPRGLATDPSGEIWIADTNNHVIRRLKNDGTVETIGGTPETRGFVDGAATVARYAFPTDIAVDPRAIIWVADAGNSSIRQLTPPNSTTTIAGTSGSGAADGIHGIGSFSYPRGVAVDHAGNVIVVDTYNHAIRKVSPDGSTTTLAGQPGNWGSADGAGSDARFDFPHAAAVDGSGNIYVTDTTNNTIRKITPAGVVATLAGQAGKSGSTDGTGSAAMFSEPEGIACDAAGNLYVADLRNSTIRKITPQGVVTTLAGTPGQTGMVDSTGAAARFMSPYGVAIDLAGNLYVTDPLAFDIRKISPDGKVTTLAGQAGVSGEVDGVGTAAEFMDPSGLGVDKSGDVFVAELGANTIREIAPDGTVTTIGGTYGGVSYADGLGKSARFHGPSGVAVDDAGNLYISEFYTSVIRKGGLTGVATPPSALTNASVRANISAGQRLIVGFATDGAKTVLMRAVGPGLQPYVSGITLASNPSLELYDTSANLLGSNDDWGGSATLANAFASVGAFPLDPASLDAAMLWKVNGTLTAHALTPVSGLGLVELYDLTPADTSARLINLSARYQVGTGSNALVAGFVVSGSAPKTVLIRGVGISLKLLFGISDALIDPVLKVFDSKQEVIAVNDNWDPRLTSTFSSVGAFQYAGVGPDAALLVSLAPGAYTAQLSGVGDTTGNGMIEVYEVGN